jgi:hypothetical protein
MQKPKRKLRTEGGWTPDKKRSITGKRTPGEIPGAFERHGEVREDRTREDGAQHPGAPGEGRKEADDEVHGKAHDEALDEAPGEAYDEAPGEAHDEAPGDGRADRHTKGIPHCLVPPPLTRADCPLHDYLFEEGECLCLTAGALGTVLTNVCGMTPEQLSPYAHRPVEVTMEKNMYTIVLTDTNEDTLTHVITTQEYNSVLQRYLN